MCASYGGEISRYRGPTPVADSAAIRDSFPRTGGRPPDAPTAAGAVADSAGICDSRAFRLPILPESAICILRVTLTFRQSERWAPPTRAGAAPLPAQYTMRERVPLYDVRQLRQPPAAYARRCSNSSSVRPA